MKRSFGVLSLVRPTVDVLTIFGILLLTCTYAYAFTHTTTVGVFMNNSASCTFKYFCSNVFKENGPAREYTFDMQPVVTVDGSRYNLRVQTVTVNGERVEVITGNILHFTVILENTPSQVIIAGQTFTPIEKKILRFEALNIFVPDHVVLTIIAAIAVIAAFFTKNKFMLLFEAAFFIVSYVFILYFVFTI